MLFAHPLWISLVSGHPKNSNFKFIRHKKCTISVHKNYISLGWTDRRINVKQEKIH